MASLPECSTASLEAGEPLLGTATDSVDRWILLEVTDSWAPDAIETEALPVSARATLGEWLREPRSRLQLIRRPGRLGKRPQLIVVSSRQGRHESAVLELDRYEDLADLDPASLRMDPAPPLWLVCVHGRRDRCCAVHGSAVYRAMQTREAEVWQTSHLGGHRFAACVLSLPHGFMYGRVRGEDVPGLLAARQGGQLGDLDLLRGRSSYDKPTQAAEVFLRRRLGLLGFDELKWLGTTVEADSIWKARFRAGAEEHPVVVKREQTEAMRPPSCGAAPEPVVKWVEAG